MKLLFVAAVVVFQCAFAHAASFEGTFFNKDIVPEAITDIEVYVFDKARTDEGCKSRTCFRLDVVLNGVWVARWAASPGNPNQPDAENTPEFRGASFDFTRIMDAGYRNNKPERAPMPYAMFIEDIGRGKGFAVHAGPTTGDKESHGCVRIEYANAPILNKWMKTVQKLRKDTNNEQGTAKIWAYHTDS